MGCEFLCVRAFFLSKLLCPLFGAVSAVMLVSCWTVIVKRELSFWYISWSMSQPSAMAVSFGKWPKKWYCGHKGLKSVEWLGSAVGEKHGHPGEVVENASWLNILGGFWAWPTGRRPQVRPRSRQRCYTSYLASGRPLEERERDIWNALLSLLPLWCNYG